MTYTFAESSEQTLCTSICEEQNSRPTPTNLEDLTLTFIDYSLLITTTCNN